MRLTSIDLYSNNNRIAALSFKDPGSNNPYIAQQVTGLDADEIVPKFYGTNVGGNTNFFDLGVNKREVVILVSLNPSFSANKSYSDLRDDLYRGISASRDGTVQLRFIKGSATIGYLRGFITKFETGLFSKTPQVQITIRCDDPMIRSLTPTSIDVTKLDINNTIVDDKSTAPHGFKFNITFDAISSDFVIRDAVAPNWQFTVTPSGGFLVDDVLYFSSAYDGHALYIDRSSTIISLVDKIELGSMWPKLFPGPNELQFIADGAFTWNEFTYNQTYWGV